jgi:hypothetical protein
MKKQQTTVHHASHQESLNFEVATLNNYAGAHKECLIEMIKKTSHKPILE